MVILYLFLRKEWKRQIKSQYSLGVYAIADSTSTSQGLGKLDTESCRIMHFLMLIAGFSFFVFVNHSDVILFW